MLGILKDGFLPIWIRTLKGSLSIILHLLPLIDGFPGAFLKFDGFLGTPGTHANEGPVIMLEKYRLIRSLVFRDRLEIDIKSYFLIGQLHVS